MSTAENPYESPQADEQRGVPFSGQRFDVVGAATVESFVHASGLALGSSFFSRRRWVLWVVALLVASVLGKSAYDAWLRRGLDELPIFLALLIPVVVVVWVTTRQRSRLRRIVHGLNSATDGAEHYVADDGVHVRGPKQITQVLWAGYEGYRASGDIVVLYRAYPDLFGFVTREMLAEPHRWEELISLLDRHLERK